MLNSAMIAMALASASPAADVAPERTVDLGNIKTVAELLQQAGYKAKIEKGEEGGTYIESAANGRALFVVFYGCKNDMGCESLELSAWYDKQPYFTAGMANEWNAKRQFLKIAIDKDGDLGEHVYISAVGRMTSNNFTDYLDWFTAMDGALAKFLEEKEEAAKAKPAPKGVGSPPVVRSAPI